MIWEVWLYSKELNKSAQQNLAKAHVSLSTADPVLPLPTEPELEPASVIILRTDLRERVRKLEAIAAGIDI